MGARGQPEAHFSEVGAPLTRCGWRARRPPPPGTARMTGLSRGLFVVVASGVRSYLEEFVSLESGTSWGPLMAAATMAIVPALLAYVVAQRDGYLAQAGFDMPGTSSCSWPNAS